MDWGLHRLLLCMKGIKDGEKVYFMVLLGAKGIDKAVKTGFSER